MGIRKRPIKHLDDQMDRWIDEVAISPRPITLTPDELDEANYPITRAETPIPIQAWARYPETVIRVRGVATEWTDRAVKIEWVNAKGAHRSAWVWASSVDRI